METILGTKIDQSIRGIVYLCDYTGEELIVCYEGLFVSCYDALQAYASIRNPASQIACGKDPESLEKELKKLHTNMQNPEWVKQLRNYL